MKILITNDDGLHAAQLVPLIKWWSRLGDVTTVVPKYEQSGKSHGIELHKPFEVTQVELEPGISVWAVDSTPADCVRYAILGMKKEFDLVVSGINIGLNIGSDIMYSGTVSAVCEAMNLGVKALALSTSPDYYSEVIKHLDSVYDYIRKHDLLSLCDGYNINIPPATTGQIRITRQGGPYYSDDFVPIEGDLYKPVGKCVYVDRQDDTLDTDAVMHGHISIMPLTISRADMDVYSTLSRLNAD